MTAYLLVAMLNGYPTVIQTAPTYEECVVAGEKWVATQIYFNAESLTTWKVTNFSCE